MSRKLDAHARYHPEEVHSYYVTRHTLHQLETSTAKSAGTTHPTPQSRKRLLSVQHTNHHPTDFSFCTASADWTWLGHHTCTDAHDDRDAAQQDCTNAYQSLQMPAAGHPTALRGCQQAGQVPADSPIKRAWQQHAQHERLSLLLLHTGVCAKRYGAE